VDPNHQPDTPAPDSKVSKRGILRWSDLANMAGAITLSRLAIAVAFPLLMRWPKVALLAYLLALLSDVVDGSLARKTGTDSHTGAVMDGWVDKILHINAAWSFALHGLIPAWWMWLWFTRELILWGMFMALVPDLRAGRVRPYTASFTGKTTAVLLAVCFVLVMLEQPAIAEPLTWLVGLFGLASGTGYVKRALDDRSRLR
jgi:phosphatidylglycerophosphate synthase